jgi:Transposase IS116/IS110/IS902 family
LDRRIVALDDEFATHAKTDDVARRLASIPGIGVLNATALAAAVGNAATFAHARAKSWPLGIATSDLGAYCSESIAPESWTSCACATALGSFQVVK